jgi:hypothetical protein
MQQALVMTFCVDTDPTRPTDCTTRGKVGKSFLSKQVLQLAIKCKFDNTKMFPGRSDRHGSISKMATSGVASGEILGHTKSQVRTYSQKQLFHDW